MDKKLCERCKVEIPSHYGNPLCFPCYLKLEEENTKKVKTEEVKTDMPADYTENEEVEELDLISRCHGRFKGTGFVMPPAQRSIYEFIKEDLVKAVTGHPQFPKFVWKQKVADVGCGLGIGANILGQEGSFIWGIDKNEESINFAKQMFGRNKNGLYYSPQITFDVIDIKTDPREFATFDVVTCIEVIEHFKDIEFLMTFLKKLANKKGAPTTYYISTPNRNAWEGTERYNKPLNPQHCFEWTAQQLFDNMSKYFSKVELLSYTGEKVDTDSKITPLVVKATI